MTFSHPATVGETFVLNEVYRYVEDAMWPFDPGAISIERYDDYIGPRFHVAIEGLRETVKVGFLHQDFIAADPERLASGIGEYAFGYIRRLPARPIPNNIILGEN